MIHLSGAITDPSGAPVSGAMIELRALNSTSEVLIGAVLTFKCDEQGAYAFDLGIGKYDAYAQNDYQGDMDYLGTAAVDESSVDGELHHVLVDGGINLTPPMLDAALDAMQRAEAAAAQSAYDRQQTGADALTTAQNRAVATDKAAESAQSAVLSAEARDSIVQDAAEVRAKAEQVSADSLAVDAGRQSVQQNADIVATNTATAIHQAGLAETAALAAQQDRVSVSDMLSDVTSKAGQAVAAADTASQKAVLAAQSEASAKADADRAENAAGSMTGAILDGGTCDLSAGVYPTPISVNGSPYSTVWYVQVGGTVSGTTFDVGDLLRYTTAAGGQYFKVDAKDEVYSVNGKKGAVTLSSIDVGADASGTADSAVAQHEAKAGAHAISGVAGLQAALDEKYSPNNKPTAADVGALGLGDTEPGSGALMRVGGPAILDADRYVLERASGGRQTIIRDAAGAANVMFVLPRFTYADIGMSADMGSGDVTAFDFGSGSIKSEIFIGAYLASGSGAVSAPMQDPRGSVTHADARNACTAKGAGWHLMTAHEWAAIALWCMANGYEPIGNTNWGRSHAKTWLIGDRADGNAPGDASGTGRTRTGSMGPAANHDNSLHGIADLVGNIWEWQDGFLLQDGRFKVSTHNTQAETGWSFINAYLDASTTTGGVPILSNQIINRLGTIGDNANTGNYAISDWRAITKSGGYASNRLLRRLLLEPSLTLPQGRIYMRNFGERLPFRGGSWDSGADAGLAAVYLNFSRVSTSTNIGFRPAFAS